MRHRVHGRKLGRTGPHRRALLRNLCTSLLEHERVKTTVQKAKEVRPLADRMITLGKRETLHARRLAAKFLLKATVVNKLFDTLAARFADRSGGYTRILKLGPRIGDGAELAIIELVSDDSVEDKESKVKGSALKESSKAKKADSPKKVKASEAKKADSPKKVKPSEAKKTDPPKKVKPSETKKADSPKKSMSSEKNK